MTFEPHDPEVVSTIHKAAARFPHALREDCIQEGWLGLVEEEVLERDDVGLGFVYTVVSQRMLHHLRRTLGTKGEPLRSRFERTKVSLDGLNDTLDDNETHLLAIGDPEEEALARIEVERVMGILVELEERPREAVLADFRGERVSEVARRFGCHPETIVDDRRRVRALLRGNPFIKRKGERRSFPRYKDNRIRNRVHKLDLDKAREIRRLRAEGALIRELAETFGVHDSTIERVLSGKSYPEPPETAEDAPGASDPLPGTRA